MSGIREVLLAIVELLGGVEERAAARKAAVFALDLGFKLELRLPRRILYCDAIGYAHGWNHYI